MHGYGVYTWNDKRKFEGSWSNCKQEGEGKYIDKNGNIKYGIWKNGIRIKWISKPIQ